MPTPNFTFFVNGRQLDNIERVISDKLLARWIKFMRIATPQLQKAYREELQAAVRKRTTRRTGRLEDVRVRAHINVTRGSVRLTPDFPRTAFSEQRGAGNRSGRVKRGQYAFVLDKSRNFGRLGKSRFRRLRAKQIMQSAWEKSG